MHGGWERIAELADRAPAADRRGTVRRMVTYLAPFRAQIGVAFLFVLAGTASQALGPALIGRAVDSHLAVGGDPSALDRSMLLLLGAYVVGLGGFIGQVGLVGRIGQQVLTRMREEIFARVQRLSMRYFDTHDAGDLMSRLVSDTEVIGGFLTQGLMQSLGSLFGLVAVVIMMVWASPILALTTFVVIPVMFWLTRVFSTQARDRYRTAREAIGEVSSNLQEDISGVRETQAFARTGRNIERFAQANAANRDANVNAVAVTSAFTPAVDVLSAVATAIVIGLGGWLAVTGRAEVGTVVAFVIWVANFFRPIQQLSAIYTQAQAAVAGAERVFDLLDEPIEVTDRPGAVELPAAEGRIAFEGVTFGYGTDQPVLHDVDLAIAPGEMVAVVGPTGAGKSTLAKLLLRYYDVDAGRVVVDGRDVRDVTQASLRRQFGVVPQEVFLFNGSIADNIRFGRPAATDAEVEAAARAVGAHDVIAALPEGYATALGERGGTLSAGQRQLVALARAALIQPRILLLDEATANIDTRTEARIQDGLETLMQGRTSLVIAHRLSTVRRADKVVVLVGGRIVESGTHADLLARQGVYAELHRQQFGGLQGAGPAGGPAAERSTNGLSSSTSSSSSSASSAGEAKPSTQPSTGGGT